MINWLKRWEYEHDTTNNGNKKYKYGKNPKTNEILLYCPSAKIYVSITNPDSMRAYAPHHIPNKYTWTSDNAPTKEIKEQ